jgi:hypothetical protein
MSKFEKLARAAVVCQQRYGQTHRVSCQEDSVVVMRGKTGFRVGIGADGELAVTRWRSPLGLFVRGATTGELAEAQAAIRDVVGRRLGALRCPYCRVALHDGEQHCLLCKREIAIADLIERATEPVPAGLFDRRCPWCNELARPARDGVRCACGAAALADAAAAARVFGTDQLETRDGGVLQGRQLHWYRRPM